MKPGVFSSIQSTINRLKTSHFVRDVVMVGGGIAAGQAAIAMIFMRHFSQDCTDLRISVSLLPLLLSSVLLLRLPLFMGYANAIVMPDSDEDAAANCPIVYIA